MLAINSIVRPVIQSSIGSALAALDATVAPSKVLADIFAGGAKGVWYERRSADSLFQESTAVTPVLSPGNPVGLGYSKDRAGARGPERVVNGAFASGSTSWGVSGSDATHTATFAGGTLRYQSDTTSPVLQVSQASVFVIGRFYEIAFDVQSWSSGSVKFDGLGGSQSVPTGAGLKKLYGIGTATTLNIYRNSANVDLTFKSISVTEMLGNHQLQASPGLRPLYQVAPQRLVFDGVDDVLTTSFVAALGASCTVGRAIPGAGAVIATGVNIGTSLVDNVTAAALVVIDRALTSGETAALTAYLNQQASS